MKVLIFDVETTGLPERNATLKRLEKYPYIVQFSWMIYDASRNKISNINDISKDEIENCFNLSVKIDSEIIKKKLEDI